MRHGSRAIAVEVQEIRNRERAVKQSYFMFDSCFMNVPNNRYTLTLPDLRRVKYKLAAIPKKSNFDHKLKNDLIISKKNPSGIFCPEGYKRQFFSIGTTALSVDYGRNDDVDQDGDEANTLGVQFVQNIDKWASEYYLGYRYHDLDRKNTDFDEINAMLTGLRVKF